MKLIVDFTCFNAKPFRPLNSSRVVLKNTGYRGTLSHMKLIPIELSESEAEGEPVAKRARADGDFGEAE